MSIASEIERLINAKVDIKVSIENKGVNVDDNATLDDYADYIDNITTGITPSGTTNITTNGTYDVTNYASANVNVQPVLQNKSIEITENGITNVTADSGYDGLNEVEVTTNVSGGGGSDLDWSVIGYNVPPLSIVNDFNYSKNIYDNWNSSVTDLSRKFAYNRDLKYMPLVDTSNATKMEAMFQNANQLMTTPLLDTSNVTTMSYMFYGCANLDTIYILDTNKVTLMNSMFYNCSKLTDESLNNILTMCINATSYTGTKTLKQIGFSSSYQSVSRIESLPKYQELLDAGWTIGY